MKTLRTYFMLGSALPVLLLSGCTAYEQANISQETVTRTAEVKEMPKMVKATSAEALLRAEGQFMIVEDAGKDSFDPLAAHKAAKARVNPRDKSKKRFQYSDVTGGFIYPHLNKKTPYMSIGFCSSF